LRLGVSRALSAEHGSRDRLGAHLTPMTRAEIRMPVVVS